MGVLLGIAVIVGIVFSIGCFGYAFVTGVRVFGWQKPAPQTAGSLAAPADTTDRSEAVIRRLATLADHRYALAAALVNARQRVVIVSPFISAGAIKADRIDEQIREAVSRGVAVRIFGDRSLNANDDTGILDPAASEGISLLQEAGARVQLLSGVHSKTLAYDNDMIAEGSFNWLSAVRDDRHRHHRHESSLFLFGGEAGQMTAQELDRLERLAA